MSDDAKDHPTFQALHEADPKTFNDDAINDHRIGFYYNITYGHAGLQRLDELAKENPELVFDLRSFDWMGGQIMMEITHGERNLAGFYSNAIYDLDLVPPGQEFVPSNEYLEPLSAAVWNRELGE